MKRQSGFTLIELIIVIIILGLLAATALPRFLNVTEQAEDAAIEGIAGGFAAAVGLVRAQWEVEGRPVNTTTNVVSFNYDQTPVSVDSRYGYPAGGEQAVAALSGTACQNVINSILQSAPRSTTNTTDFNEEPNRLFVRANNAVCYYHQVSSLKNETAAPTDFEQTGKGFTYNPQSGQVTVF